MCEIKQITWDEICRCIISYSYILISFGSFTKKIYWYWYLILNNVLKELEYAMQQMSLNLK